jgi:hypothetical protein
MTAKKRVASYVGVALIVAAGAVAVGPAASASCSGGTTTGPVCLYSGDNWTGTEWKWTPTMCFVVGYVKDLGSFRDEADSASDRDPNNRWDIDNERGGVLPDTRLARIPDGGTALGFASNAADYLKTY